MNRVIPPVFCPQMKETEDAGLSLRKGSILCGSRRVNACEHTVLGNLIFDDLQCCFNSSLIG